MEEDVRHSRSDTTAGKRLRFKEKESNYSIDHMLLAAEELEFVFWPMRNSPQADSRPSAEEVDNADRFLMVDRYCSLVLKSIQKSYSCLEKRSVIVGSC